MSVKDWYNNRTKTISVASSNATTAAHSFLGNWIANFRVRSALLLSVENKPLSSRFLTVCGTLVVDNLTTTD